jgi:hypothetical protein
MKHIIDERPRFVEDGIKELTAWIKLLCFSSLSQNLINPENIATHQPTIQKDFSNAHYFENEISQSDFYLSSLSRCGPRTNSMHNRQTIPS